MITPSGVSTKSDPPSMRRQLRKEMSEADRTLLEKKLSEKRNCCKLYFDEYFYNDDFTVSRFLLLLLLLLLLSLAEGL
jgi:hypothetical protein